LGYDEVMCLAQSLLFRWILNKQPVTILSVILHTIKFQVDGLAIREERPLFGFEHALITTSKETSKWSNTNSKRPLNANTESECSTLDQWTDRE